MTSPIHNTREQLLHALYEAAELEQNLMCSYLYAAFSMVDRHDPGIAKSNLELVDGWRRSIMAVAVDEMSHLAGVWNLTSALGGAPRFGRANFPIPAGYLPSGIIVKLAPFDVEAIEHFIHLERPDGDRSLDGAGYSASNHVSRRTTDELALTPAGWNYDTIGQFYRRIEISLKMLVDQLGEAAVFCGDPGLQLSQAEVGLPGASAVTDLASAMAVMDEIVLEGEGAPSDRSGSHFQRFITIRDEFLQASRDPSFTVAFPAAVNPVLRKPPQPDGLVWIQSADAVETVDLANALYALALRLLAASFSLPRADLKKGLYVDCAVGFMHALEPIAKRAARIPATDQPGSCNAGVTFTALRNAASFPPSEASHSIFKERVAELESVAAKLAARDGRCAQALVTIRQQLDALNGGRTGSRQSGRNKKFRDGGPNSIAPNPQSSDFDRVAGRELEVRFDGSRCIHARFCVTQAPATFLANTEGPWILPDETDAECLRGSIRQCPSGALTYVSTDGTSEPEPAVNLVNLRENGPYAFRANMAIEGVPPGYRATLCRCGASRNKPFCDKSHLKIGFVATGEPATIAANDLRARDGLVDISPEQDGPLHVRGNLEICSGTGRRVATVTKAKLCRCGGSRSKPFCDGSHRKIGFKS